jgi:DNA-binding NtrC family response regulator
MKRIIFVGKDQANSSLFAESVQDLPVEVVPVTTGHDALALVEQQHLVAVVIDVAMLAAEEQDLPQRVFEVRPNIPLLLLGGNRCSPAIATAVMGVENTTVVMPPDWNHVRRVIARLLNPGLLQLDAQHRYATNLDRVQACVERGHLEAAIAHLRMTIALNPERPEAYDLLGMIHERYGELELARKYFQIALVLDPTFEPAARNLERLCILPHPLHARGR